MQYNAQMGDLTLKQAAQANNINQGFNGFGRCWNYAFSDIRTKENIKHIVGYLSGLPVYEYEYKPEFKDHPLAGHGTHTGVMAHEVEAMYPECCNNP
jgi:hypothetical protein